MTTLSLWIDASVDTLKNCVGCLEEVRDRPGYLLVQLHLMKRHLDMMIVYLERQGK